MPERVLRRLFVRLPNWLGDALMARPLLAALRRGLPQARIVACGPGPLLELLAGDGAWDAALAWPAPGERLRAAAGGAFDAALVLPPSFSSAWHAWRCGARVRTGFAEDHRGLLLTHPVRRGARGDRHQGREYLALGAAVGVDAGALDVTALPLGEAQPPAAAGDALERAAVLAPGAAYGPAKRWPLDRFIATGRALAGRGLRVLACGGAGEREACDALAAACGGTSLAGRTSLREQAAICSRAAVVVSNDSGMAHLAGAVGARTVAIFGSTSSAWTAPLGPHVAVVQRAPVCSPCFRRTCAIGYACLEAVAVTDVLRAVDALDAARPAGACA
ncbi:MAG: lipopolysaccharide heptosyltransferase II [Candidatus Eisenbacteria bacterium]